jgi:hypothetical protein
MLSNRSKKGFKLLPYKNATGIRKKPVPSSGGQVVDQEVDRAVDRQQQVGGLEQPQDILF